MLVLFDLLAPPCGLAVLAYAGVDEGDAAGCGFPVDLTFDADGGGAYDEEFVSGVVFPLAAEDLVAIVVGYCAVLVEVDVGAFVLHAVVVGEVDVLPFAYYAVGSEFAVVGHSGVAFGECYGPAVGEVGC